MQDQPTIMGILNLTPNSFSDGGLHNKTSAAIARAIEMEEEGAHIIDIGGESTGPGSPEVKLEEELNRVIPILKEIRKSTKLPISIDTYKSEVAKQALDAGANMINDVSALRADPKMVKVLAKNQTPTIIMYSKDNSPRTTVKAVKYKDIIKNISDFFTERIEFAEKNGLKKNKLILDPGMGQFISSIPKYSYEIIQRLNELKKFELEILVGISRKSFLGGKMENRDKKSLPLAAIAYLNGASIIRTHNVWGTKEFFKKLNQ